MRIFVRPLAVLASLSTGIALAVVAPAPASSIRGVQSGHSLAATIRRPTPVNPSAPPRTKPPKPISRA